ncbi:MAG: helix-turn-helix domain-containing protein [Chitinophagaceae bacterium]|nr:helix-turn-helix domain-containing protein [Chitinophagaceae bacterium]
MQTVQQVNTIPLYSFEPKALSGHKMFRIDRVLDTDKPNLSRFLVPHRKDYYLMVFVKKGSSRHWIDMKSYDSRDNSFYFIVPHQVHLKEEIKPMTGIILSFNKDFLASDSENILKTLPIIQNPKNGHELLLGDREVIFVEDLLTKLLIEFESKENWRHTLLLSYMKILLVYLSRLYGDQFNEHNNADESKMLLNRYLSKVEESFCQEHEVSSYAGMLNISAGHLSDVIKQQSGKPAIIHIHDRLMLEAKQLLFHTENSMKEIAFQLGFEDASYFNRFFKRISGQTPMDFRKNFREKYHTNR